MRFGESSHTNYVGNKQKHIAGGDGRVGHLKLAVSSAVNRTGAQGQAFAHLSMAPTGPTKAREAGTSYLLDHPILTTSLFLLNC